MALLQNVELSLLSLDLQVVRHWLINRDLIESTILAIAKARQHHAFMGLQHKGILPMFSHSTALSRLLMPLVQSRSQAWDSDE